ncbi:unnamed protein product [Macrosiphum euphorbiae]|uniref:Uncharacterized protein n=1 Tax=Macrosiphum euphorbiae TaxID=13131 RepID=A0AAV0XXW2_9HEMI|nr:unnamed protein product [Macrosiphum euphorbiae]
MNKLQFEFMVKPSSDGKSNLMTVTSITTEAKETYAIPEELQQISFHKEVSTTTIYNMVKSSLKKRHQFRKVWIPLTEELKKVYMDDYDNMLFAGQCLEEITSKHANTVIQEEKDNLNALNLNTLKLLETLVGNAQIPKDQNLKNISEKFVLEKFTSKNLNAKHWINNFEKECIRFDVNEDYKKIEILRLFMDKSCTDWYSSMIIKLTGDSEWKIWKNKFCETFSSKGWNPVTYALLYKYRDGSLLDYAIKKEKLLLDMRTTIDSGTLIDLIAAGLPEFILNRIDREVLKDTVDLFSEISNFEHMVIKKKSFFEKKKILSMNYKEKNEEKKPCKHCEKLNKGTRYHPESVCWFNTRENDREKKNYIKHVNNSVVEAELNDTDQKN